MATPNYKVYEGLWINLSEGRVKGATLTLSQTKAAYLIAFLALFVHFAGTSLWRFTSFLLFRSRAHLAPGDKTALQQQATLRNAPSAITALVNLVAATVRSSVKRWDSIALSVWALANFIAFLAAGILSSRVANTQPDVLLQPTICGRWWENSFGGSREGFIDNRTEFYQDALQLGAVQNLHLASSRFKSVCYDGSKVRDGCLWFVREPIGWTGKIQSGCPFGDDICVENKTFAIESEWIESDRHLGINSERTDRLRMQVRKTCSPLKRNGYFEVYGSNNITTLIPLDSRDNRWDYKAFETGDSTYGAFFYGPVGYGPLGSGGVNATFVHSNATLIPNFNNPPPVYTIVTAAYDHCSIGIFESGACQTSFEPIPSLRIPEKNIAIIFLTSTTEYCGPVTDPWFDAPNCDETWYGSTWQTFLPTYPTTTLACAEEKDICVSDSRSDEEKCTKIRGDGYPFTKDENPASLPNITQILELTSGQEAIANRIQDASSKSTFANLVYNVGGSNMLAFGQAETAVCTPALPADQWAKEVENWFATTLLNIQLYNTQFVTGWSSNNEINKHITPPPDDDKWMCDAQIVRTTMYTNFSLLGILLILLVGGAFIALRLCTPYLVHKLQGSSTRNEHRRATWDELNLPRLADDAFEKQQSASDDERSVNSPQTSRVYITNSWKSG